MHVSVDEEDDVLAILVTDNGVGMSEEVKAHIFDNGFSTKEKKGQGHWTLFDKRNCSKRTW